MKVNIRKISEKTGFSPATVSNALNHKRGVNKDTAAEILKTAKEMGYVTEAGITKIKLVIYRDRGLIVGDNPFFSLVVDGFEKACREAGYVGEKPVFSKHGVVSSLAWGMDGKVTYVLEGNINYTGAVITWLCKDLKLIQSPKETEELARQASVEDSAYLVPAFTGLGAPYWESNAKALLCGMSRTTGKAEVVRAALECIAYQITDIIKAMEDDSGISIQELRVDGGPTKNQYLMKFQSDIAEKPILIPKEEELSETGAAYAAGEGDAYVSGS